MLVKAWTSLVSMGMSTSLAGALDLGAGVGGVGEPPSPAFEPLGAGVGGVGAPFLLAPEPPLLKVSLDGSLAGLKLSTELAFDGVSPAFGDLLKSGKLLDLCSLAKFFIPS